jgi:hypothetical protein
VSSQTLRRSSIARAPVSRHVYRPAGPLRIPRWLRNLLLGLLVLLLIALALLALRQHGRPQSLAGSSLAGPRKVNGAACIEEAVDVSGSMTAFRSEREAAERELFTFARRALAPSDQFSSAFFSETAALALAPTSMSALSTPPAVPSGLQPAGTELIPAVEQLAAARTADERCAIRALVVITDGELGDDPPALERALTSAAYSRAFAVIPSATGWSRPAALPDSIEAYHFRDGGWLGRVVGVFTGAEPLDVVLGEILGSLTGQTLVRTGGSTS